MSKPETVRYTLSLTIDRPIRWEDCDTDGYSMAEILDEFVGKKALREVEREVLQALKKLDGDCDCEVQETGYLDADGQAMSEPYEPDEAYERAAARARLNDFEDTDGKDWT